MTDTTVGDIIESDIVVNQEEGGYLAFLGLQPLTAFPPFSGLPPAKYYTGGFSTSKEEAINKLVDKMIEHLTKLKHDVPTPIH